MPCIMNYTRIYKKTVRNVILQVVGLALLAPTALHAQENLPPLTEDRAYLGALTSHIVNHQLYPTSAKLYGMEGDALVSIQVDKKGNIVNYRFIREATHPLFHDAIIDVLKASNPAPVPPRIFFQQGQELAEFMFPVAFRIGMDPSSLMKIDEEFQSMILNLSYIAPQQQAQ